MSKFDEKSARAMITRNGGKIRGNLIYVTKPGMGVLSAIDYLEHYCEYLWAKPEQEEDNG